MIRWPGSALAEWGDAAESFARARLTGIEHGSGAAYADPAFPPLLDQLRAVGFAELCADARLDGLEQGPAALARVLEPLAAADAAAAGAVYATAAAHLAIRAARLSDDAAAALPAADAGWLAWPAFHHVDEQEWPRVHVDGTIRGRCEMLLLGAHADHAVLPARDDDGGLRLVLVDLRATGVRRGTPVRTLGLSPTGIVDLEFDGGVHPVLLAEDGADLLGSLAESLAVAATAMLCGVMRTSLAVAQQYAHDRYQGGGPIIGWGEVKRLLSLQHERLHVAQGTLTAVLTEDGASRPADLAARYGQLHVGSLACDLTTDGVQLLGGNGYMTDYGQERRMRDARQLHCLTGGPAWRRQQLSTASTAAPVSR